MLYFLHHAITLVKDEVHDMTDVLGIHEEESDDALQQDFVFNSNDEYDTDDNDEEPFAEDSEYRYPSDDEDNLVVSDPPELPLGILACDNYMAPLSPPHNDKINAGT